MSVSIFDITDRNRVSCTLKSITLLRLRHLDGVVSYTQLRVHKKTRRCKIDPISRHIVLYFI